MNLNKFDNLIFTMKYRRLTISELEETQDSFIRFLATNGIDKDEWVKLKKNKAPQVETLIETYSDMVFERVITSVELLQHTEPKEIKLFKCEKDKIFLVGLSVEASDDFNFIELDNESNILEVAKKSNAKLSLFAAEKAYKPDRNSEIFRMMETGCKIQKNTQLYDTLKKLAEQKK